MDIEPALHGLGWAGPLLIIGARGLAAMLAVVPSSPILLAAGSSYGVFWGSVLILIGAEAGALLAFLIGRRLGYDYVARRGWIVSLSRTLPGRWLLCGNNSQRRLMMAVLYCRLVPGLNLDGLSYVAGVTPLTTWRFALATFAGLLPYTLLLTVIGRQLTTVEAVVAAAVVIGLLTAILPLILRWSGMWPAAMRSSKEHGRSRIKL
jgi:uncharacterized membrane protein YdjX (TVP38/TMEM64 family)